ncbi:MAG: DsbC family protein [Nitrospirae bacterium]|nr:DsbC family protein [Nitrospirota bacterium]
MKITLFALFIILYGLTINADHVSAHGGCESDCGRCHRLKKSEAESVVKDLGIRNAKIIGIQTAEIKSLWEIAIETDGKRGIIYLDFSKNKIISGNIIDVKTKLNNTAEAIQKIQPKVDFSKIKLNYDLVMGNAHGSKKVVVVTDPNCGFCAKLHEEIKKVIAENKNVGFFIKLFPLNSDSRKKAQTVICSKNLKNLEANFQRKETTPVTCTTGELDENIALFKSFDITGTPALIMEDGSVYVGYRPAQEILKLLK